jgi:putative intracellular protease/amidase/YHS domain-containing protein
MKSSFWGKYLVAVLVTGCHASSTPPDENTGVAVATPPVSTHAGAAPAPLAHGHTLGSGNPRAHPQAIPLPASSPAQPMTRVMTPPVKVAVLVYPGVELLDFSGPTEVFSNVPGVQVYLVSTGNKVLTTKGRTLHLMADYTLATAPQPDILVVPGGPMEVVADVYRNPAALAWIKQADQGTQLTMSVCTGAFILSRAGLTRHKHITSHWGAVDSLQRFDPQAIVRKDQRFVEDGKLLTTAGVSAGIDGALRVVEELRGRDEAVMVTRLMQYDKWQPSQGVVLGKSGIPAPAALATTVVRDPVCRMAVMGTDAPSLAYQGVTYHFCSPGCRENFRRHPAQYAQH